MNRIAVSAVAAAFLAAGGLLSVGARADEAGKALFEEKCKICHELERPLGQRKDRAGWTTTVMRMKDFNGCPVTTDEANRIIDYLVEIRGPEVKK